MEENNCDVGIDSVLQIQYQKHESVFLKKLIHYTY